MKTGTNKARQGKKQVIVVLTEEEHQKITLMAQKEKRALGNQLAVMALKFAEKCNRENAA